MLVRQVSLRKRYDIQSVVDRYVAQFPEIVAREINAAADASAVLRRYGDEPSALLELPEIDEHGARG